MIKYFLIYLSFFLFYSKIVFPQGMNAPFPRQRSFIYRSSPPTSSIKIVFSSLIQFYSYYISPADGPRSPSYPTGSAYGRQAIEQYGLFLGVILTAERLIHETDKPLGPIVTLYHYNRFYDPIESNTFWWKKLK